MSPSSAPDEKAELRRGLAEADRLVDSARSAGTYSSPPVPLESLAALVNIRKIVRLDIRESGRLVPVGQSFVVELNASEHRYRQRFTLAHEIGHVLLSRSKGRNQVAERYFRCSNDSQLERACDRIAGRLILPPRELRQEVERHGHGLSDLVGVARRFEVSWQAFGFAMSELFDDRILICWRHSDLSGSKRPAYRVAWSASGSGTFIPKGAASGNDPLVEQCVSEWRSLKGEMTLRLGTLRGSYPVELLPVGRARRQSEVLMLVHSGRRN